MNSVPCLEEKAGPQILLKVTRYSKDETESKIMQFATDDLVVDCVFKMCKKFGVVEKDFANEYALWKPPPAGFWLLGSKKICEYNLRNRDEVELRLKTQDVLMERPIPAVQRLDDSQNSEHHSLTSFMVKGCAFNIVKIEFPERNCKRTLKVFRVYSVH